MSYDSRKQTVYVPGAMLRRMKAESATTGRSLSAIVQRAYGGGLGGSGLDPASLLLGATLATVSAAALYMLLVRKT